MKKGILLAMKVLYVFCVAQLFATTFLVLKVVTLDEQIQFLSETDAIRIASQNNATFPAGEGHENYPKPDHSYTLQQSNSITLIEIRNVISEELDIAIGKIAWKAEESKDPTEFLSHIPSDPEGVEKLYSRLDYFMSDGELSTVEMQEVESNLASMNYDDRQRVLQKMAQAMSKANIKFSR